MDGPKLIENNVRHYVINSLYMCHENRIKRYSTILNVSFLLIFIVSFIMLFYFCWKNRLTPDQQYEKLCKSRMYVKNKIRNHQIDEAKKHVTITKLPTLINELQ